MVLTTTSAPGRHLGRAGLGLGLLGGGLLLAGCGTARGDAASAFSRPAAATSSVVPAAPIASPPSPSPDATSGWGTATGTVVAVPPATVSPSPTPRPTPLPAACRRSPATRCLVSVSIADAGRSYRLPVRARIRLLLQGSRAWPWHGAKSSDPRVLRAVPDPLMIAIPIGWVRSDFLVERPGRSTVSALQSPACATAHPPCLAPDRLFAVTVVATR